MTNYAMQNCGLENPTGNEKCLKCHAPLEINKNIHNDSLLSTAHEGVSCDNLKATVLEAQAFAPRTPNSEPTNTTTDIVNCPNCQYPLTASMNSCHNCGHQVVSKILKEAEILKETPTTTGKNATNAAQQ